MRPERSNGFDIGIEQKFAGGRYSIDLTYFNQDLQDEIAGFGNTSINLDGESKREGVEVTARGEVLPGLDLSASYTYLRAREPGGDIEVRRPKHIASLQASYRFLENRANVNFGLRYNGAMEDFDFRPVFPAPTGRVTLDDYVLANITASYRLTDFVQLFGRVENLFDEDYEDVFGYENPGVAVFGGLRITFGR